MKTLLVLLFIVVASASFGQQQNDNAKLNRSLESVIGVSERSGDSVMNTSFVASGGEKFLRLGIVVDASLSEVWKTIATEEGLKKWIAPVVQLDLRVGGSVKTNYNKTARIEDKGTISLGILSYLPSEMLILKVTLNNTFSEKCRREDKNLQEIIQIKSLGEHTTKITSTMIGWGEGKEWGDTYNFFEKGNTWTFQELIHCFKK
jgi:hypothetical protein